VEIGKYIHELLLENDLVIIPGFGAFVTNYKPAEINRETNEMKPPSKEVTFNRQIRNNDGLLVGSVAGGEAVSHFDALKLIEKERENIIYKLDKGEKVTIAETGELFVDEKNEVRFTPFDDENMLLDSYGLETVALEKEAKKEEETPVVVATNKPENDGEKEEEVTEPEKEIIPPVVEPAKNEEKPEEKEEKKRRGGYWFLLILIPLFFVGFFLYKQQAEKKPQQPKQKKSEELVIKKAPVVVTPDTVVVDSTTQAVQDTLISKEKEDLPVEQKIDNQARFYLVGGSFKAEKNAKNYLIELKKRGFEPFILGKRGNFYIVGIGKYNTEKEALQAKRKFTDENPKSGVWVMEDK